MTLLQAILLGLVQGITEFFPISSSAHLKICRSLLSLPPDLFFDLVCHFGTLCSLVFFLHREILQVFKSIRLMALFTLALTPLIPAYFFLKPLREALSDPYFLGYSLMLTGLILFLASKKKDAFPKKKWQHVLCIGAMQTAALIPGISRSGSTIATARFLGWDWKEAAKFSFLLSIPTILGGQILEMRHFESASNFSFSPYFAGWLASFLMGLLGVRLMFWVYEKGRIQPIAYYCLGLGFLVQVVFHG